MAEEHVDVVVVGGGPGGSTTAALLAKRGRSVLLLERQKFPRYHIGESLVPGVVPVLEELGLTDDLDRFGFVQKYGISLVWGADPEPWPVGFGEGGSIDHAWQVTRADFDNLLLNRARHMGATVIEEARVTDVTFAGPQQVRVGYRLARSDEARHVTARHVVDASGQSTLLAREHDDIAIEWEEGLRNLAVWAYFQGGDHYTGRRAGDILTADVGEGWVWVIPLHDGTRSVGFVAPVDRVRASGEDLGRLMEERIEASPEVGKLLAGTRRVSAFHTAKDWSYRASRFQGPGYTLVGDAAGFVDPLFSTGVYLAMNGASLAAAQIDGILAEPERAEELGAEYERGYRGFLEIVLSFVHYFYDRDRRKEEYWGKAQELVDPRRELIARQDFVYLISGLAGRDGVLGRERDAARKAAARARREAKLAAGQN
jgi:halogenation protein CepH